MPIDEARVEAVLALLTATEADKGAQGEELAARLTPAELNALLKQFTLKKTRRGSADGVWYELGAKGQWTEAALRVFFSRPGATWDKKWLEIENLQLRLSDRFPVRKLEWLSGLKLLHNLQIVNAPYLTSLDGLAPLRQLERLRVCGPALVEIGALRGLSTLTELSLIGAERLASLETLGSLPLLQLAELNELPPAAQQAGVLKQLSSLEVLQIRGWRTLSSLDAVSACRRLRVLDASFCTAISSLEPLAALPELEELTLQGLDQLASLDGLQGLKRLRKLDLSGCSKLANLAAVEDRQDLELILPRAMKLASA